MYCRFRPPNEYEISHSTNNSVILLSQKQLIITQEKKLELKKDYVFDGLFDFDTSKEKFYDKTCKQIISNVLKGYNGGIICYGETGTGKTSTINNIIPFVISQIFDYINETDINNVLFKIDVSIIEIYKEQVNDLIDIKNTNLNLIEQKNKKLIIDNLTHIGISSEEQLSKVINQGITNRNNNYPSYKEHNSKSHFIIMITLYHYYKQENYMKIGTLYLVDLEGSERISKSNIEGESLDEQKLINKSLIALSIIVQNLSNESDNITYAPYRDSKLTRILSDCFGGNAYTTLILHCSKHERSTVETRNTLMFGERAKKIKNKPVINIENNADKSIIMGEIFGLRKDSNQNYDRSYNDISNRNLGGKENQFLKLQIKQLKEKIELDNSEIEQLNERNGNLEEENRKLKEDKELCGFNLMVTSEIKLSDNDIYRIYHNLWRIEESFRIMKSELDARPVYLQKSSTIFGHFLICYIATLITRILQIYELNDEDSYQAIFKFVRDFQLAKCNGKYVNLLTKSDFLDKISELTKLPVKSALLTQKQYEKIMNYRFK